MGWQDIISPLIFHLAEQLARERERDRKRERWTRRNWIPVWFCAGPTSRITLGHFPRTKPAAVFGRREMATERDRQIERVGGRGSAFKV